MFDWRKAARRPTSLFGGRILQSGGWLLLVLLVTASCAAGVRSSLLEVDVRLASPALGLGGGQAAAPTELPVVYPAGVAMVGESDGIGENPMIANFGPAWQGLEPVYDQYRFNPFAP